MCNLNQKEVLTSLKKAVDDKILKIVNKNSKNSYRVLQECHLDENCVIVSQIDEASESTDVDRDLSSRLDKISCDDLKNLTNEFRFFKVKT